jgi:uncharacterized membrane protein YsdA (DUF1294 family)
MATAKKVSNVLYILPIIFGWIGGVIGYFVARSQGDQNKANKVFLLGIGITVGIFVLTVGLGEAQNLGIPLTLLT